MTWPGQACGYRVGQLKILDIRAHAERELGDALDLTAFHDKILGMGGLPLDVLEREMKAWVEAEKG